MDCSDKLRFEHERLKTFKNWPALYVSPKELAKNGFYYTGVEDVVMCFYCGIGLHHWFKEVPAIEHRYNNSECDLLNNKHSTPNIEIVETLYEVVENDDDIK
ncbi:IAP [Penaeus monodon nudivirus]|uniref:IAP n=1 Tax=Penaeus monodon nudivirus TaxID=1529056 RepID=A0A076FET4_9VIRU|nr:IAP [Penaeus monodon nudivirus]AII15894.1 IAP [Penaeus monodon nudivirus]